MSDDTTGGITADDHAIDAGQVEDDLGFEPSTDNARGEHYYEEDADRYDDDCDAPGSEFYDSDDEESAT